MMSQLSKQPLLVRKGFIVFQNSLFVTIPLLVIVEKYCFIDFFLIKTHLFRCLLYSFSLTSVGFLINLILSLLLVCVCVCILFHREGFFRLQDVLDILEGTDQRCCVVSIIRNAAAKFPHLGI